MPALKPMKKILNDEALEADDIRNVLGQEIASFANPMISDALLVHEFKNAAGMRAISCFGSIATLGSGLVSGLFYSAGSTVGFSTSLKLTGIGAFLSAAFYGASKLETIIGRRNIVRRFPELGVKQDPSILDPL